MIGFNWEVFAGLSLMLFYHVDLPLLLLKLFIPHQKYINVPFKTEREREGERRVQSGAATNLSHHLTCSIISFWLRRILGFSLSLTLLLRVGVSLTVSNHDIHLSGKFVGRELMLCIISAYGK